MQPSCNVLHRHLPRPIQRLISCQYVYASTIPNGLQYFFFSYRSTRCFLSNDNGIFCWTACLCARSIMSLNNYRIHLCEFNICNICWYSCEPYSNDFAAFTHAEDERERLVSGSYLFWLRNSTKLNRKVDFNWRMRCC